MNEQQNEAEIRKGAQAAQLLNSPLYVEAVEKVRMGLVQRLEMSAIGDKDTHHEIALSLQLLKQVHQHIKTVAETGKMAEIERQNWLQSMKNRIKRVA